LTEPADFGSNPAGDAHTLEQDVVGYDSTRGNGAPQAQTATLAISPSGDLPETANLHHLTEEDDENADTWELDDGYAVWDETFEGDDLDTALAGEPDSASTDSSTLSGKTTSIASKRSFGEIEVEESESLVEQSSLQSQLAIYRAVTSTYKYFFRPEKNANTVTWSGAFTGHPCSNIGGTLILSSSMLRPFNLRATLSTAHIYSPLGRPVSYLARDVALTKLYHTRLSKAKCLTGIFYILMALRWYFPHLVPGLLTFAGDKGTGIGLAA